MSTLRVKLTHGFMVWLLVAALAFSPFADELMRFSEIGIFLSILKYFFGLFWVYVGQRVLKDYRQPEPIQTHQEIDRVTIQWKTGGVSGYMLLIIVAAGVYPLIGIIPLLPANYPTHILNFEYIYWSHLTYLAVVFGVSLRIAWLLCRDATGTFTISLKQTQWTLTQSYYFGLRTRSNDFIAADTIAQFTKAHVLDVFDAQQNWTNISVPPGGQRFIEKTLQFIKENQENDSIRTIPDALQDLRGGRLTTDPKNLV